MKGYANFIMRVTAARADLVIDDRQMFYLIDKDAWPRGIANVFA